MSGGDPDWFAARRAHNEETLARVRAAARGPSLDERAVGFLAGLVLRDHPAGVREARDRLVQRSMVGECAGSRRGHRRVTVPVRETDVFDFLAAINLQDHSLAEQREAVALAHALRARLHGVESAKTAPATLPDEGDDVRRGGAWRVVSPKRVDDAGGSLFMLTLQLFARGSLEGEDVSVTTRVPQRMRLLRIRGSAGARVNEAYVGCACVFARTSSAAPFYDIGLAHAHVVESGVWVTLKLRFDEPGTWNGVLVGEAL